MSSSQHPLELELYSLGNNKTSFYKYVQLTIHSYETFIQCNSSAVVHLKLILFVEAGCSKWNWVTRKRIVEIECCYYFNIINLYTW